MNYLTELIIRPQRNVYNLKDLGDSAFSFSGQDFKRLDFTNGQIRNLRGERISCSLWCPLDSTTKDLATSPMIIYCHGNAGNKIDIIEIFEFLLWEFNICSFDFSGAGFSEGDYVTLGYFEKFDIQAVVEFLRKEFGIKSIILYGRSMGAVSSLRYSEMDPNIKACVLDSPFCNFPKLCEEILSNKFFIPIVMSKYLISSARKRLLEKVDGFDIDNFIPANNAKKVKVPTLLIHGKEDELVHISHSREIFKNINRNTCKLLLEVDGYHNDTRPPQSVNTIRDFIMQYSYDALILKEHRRRLNIKNAHLNFNAKYSIDINSIVENFRINQEIRHSFLNTSNLEKNLGNNKDSLNSMSKHQNLINHNLKQEISKTLFDKISLEEEEVEKLKFNISNYQTESKREPRRLNNFNIDFNLKSSVNKKSKNFNKNIKQIFKSKSLENSNKKNNSYAKSKGDHNKDLPDDNLSNLNNDPIENSKFRRSNKSLFHSNNDKFYAATLFKEENFFNLDDLEKAFLFENDNDYRGSEKNQKNNFDLYEDNINVLKELSANHKKKPKNYFIQNYNENNLNNNGSESDIESLKKRNSFNHQGNQNVFLFNNKNYFDLLDKNNENEKNNKTFCIDNRMKEPIDNSLFTTQDSNNYTDIYSGSPTKMNSGRGKLNTRRNQVFTGILDCDIKLGSSQITITDLDRTSLRKGRTSICNNTTINENDETNNDEKSNY